MRLTEIHLENFRCFERFDAGFHPQCTVFAGVNGAGKSSLLEALAISLGAWFKGFDTLAAPTIEKAHVRLAEHRIVDPTERIEAAAAGNIGLVNQELAFPVLIQARADVRSERTSWRCRLHRLDKRTIYNGKLIEVAQTHQAAVVAGDPVELPLLAYYRSNRFWRPAPSDDGEVEVGSRLLGYESCFDPSVTHGNFERWMRGREQARLQRLMNVERFGNKQTTDEIAKRIAALLKGEGDVWLSAVEHAAASCVDDAASVFFDMTEGALVVVLENGSVQHYRMLSDGYRSLVAMAADIAWRAVQLNPHLGKSAPAKVEGVVLIDEIELHLHPKWQRSVLPNLMKAFPKLQFIITTHSPQVIASAERDMVRVLDGGPRAHRVSATEGRDTNALLEDIMGVSARPQWALDELAKLASKIEEEKYEEAEALYENLLPRLGRGDSDLAGARWQIDHERMMDDAEGE